jgi:hypothetical protein
VIRWETRDGRRGGRGMLTPRQDSDATPDGIVSPPKPLDRRDAVLLGIALGGRQRGSCELGAALSARSNASPTHCKPSYGPRRLDRGPNLGYLDSWAGNPP